MHRFAAEGRRSGIAGLPNEDLATVVVPITLMTEIEPQPAATVGTVAVLDVEKSVVITFVCLCRTLEAGKSYQAETGRAREPEKLRVHGELPFGAGEGGGVRPS
jgi:hypothetical protein